MSTDRATLATLVEICGAEVESARLALVRAERELTAARDREKRVDADLDATKQRRAEECERFDRRVEQHGSTIAEIQLFEERIAGFASEIKQLGGGAAAARAQTAEADANALTLRKKLNDRLADQKLLSGRLLEEETAISRQEEEMEWDERDALAVRRHTEEA